MAELGDAQVDFSIGAAWPKRARAIAEALSKLPEEAKQEKLKITITLNGESL